MNSRAAIEIRNVGKTYSHGDSDASFRALDGVSLDIAPGEFLSIIGPSGCGKTTLLKMIDGLVPFDDGELLVFGEPVSKPRPDIAMVFQNFALLPWMSVRENIAFGLQLRGENRRRRLERASEYVTMVGLEGFADSYPWQLSGGMQQRVGLARALAVEPNILLMDEPFGAVDAQTRNLLQVDLLRIWEATTKTVVFVTHAMDEAVFLSDRVVIMGTRPGHVAEVIDVDLPRPRTDETRSQARMVELSSHVWEVLRTLIVRDGQSTASAVG